MLESVVTCSDILNFTKKILQYVAFTLIKIKSNQIVHANETAYFWRLASRTREKRSAYSDTVDDGRRPHCSKTTHQLMQFIKNNFLINCVSK